MLKRIMYGTAALALAGGLMAAPVAGQAATKMVMSNYTNATSLKGRTFDHLKALVEKNLGGQIDVEVHHSGTLFSQKTEIQGLQLGSVQLIAPTTGIFSSISPKINAMLLPFLLSTPAAIQKAVDDPLIRKTFFTELEKKNVLPVAVWINGPRYIGYKGHKPVMTPADMKGLKIRVQPADIFVKTMKAFGANVITMNWGEVPAAIQQGVIDAAEPTPNAWVSSKLYEVVDDITLVPYVYSYYLVATNKQWWDGLDSGVRQKLQTAIDATTKWNWAQGKQANAVALDKIKAAGVKLIQPSEADMKLWVAAVKPVWKELGTDVVGQKVMDRLEEIGGVK